MWGDDHFPTFLKVVSKKAFEKKIETLSVAIHPHPQAMIP